MQKAFILDFNGVIISDEQYHKESWRRLVKSLGLNLSEKELEEEVFGHRESEVFSHLLNRKVSEQEVQKLSKQRNKIVYKLEGDFIPVDGVVDFIKEAKKENIPLGLATNSRRDYMTNVLQAFKIQNSFDTIVTAEDVTLGKPDPQIYLKTADALNIHPNYCLVFEDTSAGIHSAKEAGMKVIALTTTHKDKNVLKDADKIISDFTEINIEDCRRMLSET